MKRLNRLIFFLLFLVPVYLGFSQEITPAYIDSLFELGEQSLDKELEENNRDLKTIDSLSRTIEYDIGLFKANMGLAYNGRRFDPNISWKYITIMDSLFQRDPTLYNDTTTIYYFLVKGYILGERNDKIRELEFYIKSDSLATAFQNEYFKSIVNFHFSNYYNNKSDFEKALTYNNKLVAYYARDLDAHGTNYSYLMSVQNSASIYYKLEEYDSAITYANLAIALGLGEFAHLDQVYTVLGKSYLEKKEFKASESYSKKIRTLDEQGLPLKYGMTTLERDLLLGQLYTKSGNLDSAYFLLNRAKKYADSTVFLAGQSRVNYALIEWGLKKNNCAELIVHVDEIRKSEESMYSIEKEKIESQLLVQFETAKKEKEIKRLQYLDEKNRVRQTIIVFGSLLLILIALFIIYRVITKRKLLAQKLMNLEFEKQAIEGQLNQTLENIKEKISTINQLKTDLDSSVTSTDTIDRMTDILDRNYIDDSNWIRVMNYFDQLNNDFTKKVKLEYEKITKNDLQLLVLIRLNYSIKDIAITRNVTEGAVKKAKTRLLIKLELNEFSELKI